MTSTGEGRVFAPPRAVAQANVRARAPRASAGLPAMTLHGARPPARRGPAAPALRIQRRARLMRRAVRGVRQRAARETGTQRPYEIGTRLVPPRRGAVAARDEEGPR